MDFFTELLDSFSRKHGRKLRLIEQDDPRADKGGVILKQYLDNMQAGQQIDIDNKNPNATTPTVRLKYTGQLPDGSRKALVARNSVTLGANGSISANDAKTLRAALTILVGKSDSDSKKPSEPELTDEEKRERDLKKITGEGVAPGVVISEGNFQNEDARQDATVAFENMAVLLDQAFANIGLDVTKYKSTYFGKRIESLEKRISQSNKYLVYNEDFNGYVFEDGALIDDQIVGIAQTLENMMKSLATDTCPEGDQSFTKNIAMTKRGEIVISPRADANLSEALVFTDDKGLLKDSMTKAFEKCKFEDGIPQISILSEETGGNSDNNTLGTGFELFQKLATLVQGAARIRASGEEVPNDLGAELRYVADKLQKRMSGLSASARTAFIIQKTAGLSPEDSSIVNDLRDLLTGTDDDGLSLYRKMLEFSLAIVKDRNPDYITEAGQETKFGQRQDIREYYSSEDKARKALAKSGLNPNNYDLSSLNELRDAGFMTSRDVRAALALKMVPDEDTPIAVTKTSMKAYRSLKRVTWGKGSENTYLEMMKEGFGEGDHGDLISTMLDDMGVSDQDKPAEWQRMVNYHRELANIHDSVESVPLTTEMLSSDGKQLLVKSGDILADQVETILSNNSSYSELTDGDRSHIISIIKNLKKEKGKEYTKEALFVRLKKEVVTFLTHKKLESDLANSSTRDNALRSILSKVYHAGGSSDSKLNETAFGWAESRTHVFSRNDVLRDIAQGRRGWDIDSDGSDFSRGIIHFSSGPAKIILNTTAKATRTKKSKRANINNESQLTATEEVSDMYDSRQDRNLRASTEILNALGSLQETLTLIKKKVGIFNTN